jgi:hypothetical protein
MSLKVVCPTCNTGYKLAKAPTRTAETTCKNCGGRITVNPAVEEPLTMETTPTPQTTPYMDSGDRVADNPSFSPQTAGVATQANEASNPVESAFPGTIGTIEDDEMTFDTLIPAVVGGGLAAVVGGAVWGLTVNLTGYEIGYVAWAIGLVAGFGVLLFARGRKGPALQIIAVLSSVLGILIGKYFTFFHVMKETVTNDYGAEVASKISMFSGKLIALFGSYLVAMSSPFDFLWVILAVGTAWSIPKWGGDEEDNE